MKPGLLPRTTAFTVTAVVLLLVAACGTPHGGRAALKPSPFHGSLSAPAHAAPAEALEHEASPFDDTYNVVECEAQARLVGGATVSVPDDLRRGTTAVCYIDDQAGRNDTWEFGVLYVPKGNDPARDDLRSILDDGGVLVGLTVNPPMPATVSGVQPNDGSVASFRVPSGAHAVLQRLTNSRVRAAWSGKDETFGRITFNIAGNMTPERIAQIAVNLQRSP